MKPTLIMHVNYCELLRARAEPRRHLPQGGGLGFDGVEFRCKRIGIEKTAEAYLNALAKAVERTEEDAYHCMLAALKRVDHKKAWRAKPPIEITVEWAWSGRADFFARIPGVDRPQARVNRWKIKDARDIYCWPSREWHPGR